MEWRRWRACNHVRRFQLRRMSDQRWGGGDGEGDRSHGGGGAFGNDLCGTVQRGQGQERKTCPDEGQRCLGSWPLHRRADLGDYAGRGQIRERRWRRLCQAAVEDKLSATCERGTSRLGLVT